jgi:hypothetical protein
MGLILLSGIGFALHWYGRQIDAFCNILKHMNEQSFHAMIVLFSAGMALLLASVVDFLLAKRSRFTRFWADGLCCLSSGALPAAFASPSLALGSVGLSLGGLLVLFGITSGAISTTAAWAMKWVRRPVGQGSVLATLGLGLMVVSLVAFSWEEERTLDQDMLFLEEVTSTPPVHNVDGQDATTDRGRPIALAAVDGPREKAVLVARERKLLETLGYSERFIRTGPANDACNCHGWVFTGGRYWLSPDDVSRILEDNGYAEVSNPRVGDLVIYRKSGTIIHSALVRAAESNSNVLVESKWGWMGSFLHRVSDTCYGHDFTFYRTSRPSPVVDIRPLDGKEKAVAANSQKANR